MGRQAMWVAPLRQMRDRLHRLPLELWGVLALAALMGGGSPLLGLEKDNVLFYLAALREVGGQVPYLDYYVPQGILTGVVGAPFLALFGVGWGIVVSSAFTNALATAAVWWIVARVGDRRAALIGGLLTAVWFLPVMGSFYVDHLAYLLVLLAAIPIVGSWARSPVWAGVVMALAFQTKQPVALAGLVSLALLTEILPRSRWARWGELLLGFVVGTGAFLGYFALLGVWEHFVTYSIQFPMDYAVRNGEKNFSFLVRDLVFPWHFDPRQWTEVGWGRLTFIPVVLTVYLAYGALWKERFTPRSTVLLFFLLSTIWGAALLGRYHGHLFFGTGGFVALSLLVLLANRAPWVGRGVVGVLILMGAAQLFGTRVPRVPWDLRFRQTAIYPIPVEKNAQTHDLLEIAHVLRAHPSPYALMDANAFLLPLLVGRASVAPPLYYQSALTAPLEPKDRPRWERHLVERLDVHGAQYLVVGRFWEHRGAVFERLRGFIGENFAPELETTHFVLLKRNAQGAGRVALTPGK